MCLLTPFNMFLRLLLIGLPLTSCSIPVVPAGTFTTNCHERHFWLSVKGSFLRSILQFYIEDSTGVHFLSSQRAAECGYTVVLNHRGNLVFRASYLACYVENRGDTEFRVSVWFVNMQTDGSVNAYPFMLHCSLVGPWSLREIVCEENYMEVSIKWPVPILSREGVKWLELQSQTLEERVKQLRTGQVIFYRPGDFDKTPRQIEDVKAIGYHIIATDTRILLRSAYSSLLSYTTKEKNVQVEAVSAIIMLQLEGTSSIPVEISVACAKTEAVVDGLYLLWSFPLALSPLVRGWFRTGAMRLGVDGRVLSDYEMRNRGYNVSLKDQTVNIRIPFDKEGAKIKSHVLKGQYAQSLSVEFFYMYHWDDAIWPHTQHRSFLLLRTPYMPRTPIVLNNTDPSTEMFSVTLGVFPADVSLQNITLGGDTMTWTEANQHNIHLKQILFSNGSHAYELQVPFSHPMVTQRVISGHYRRQSLALTFDLVIFPEEEHFSYRTNVMFDQKEPALSAVLGGSCTERGVMVVLHYGSEDVQWELYVGDRRLDWELVQLGGYRLDGGDDHFSVEIPLYSPGMAYEDLNLKNMIVKVEVSAVNMVTLKAEHSLVQRCTFPVRDFLVCLPEGRIVVVTDTTRSIPPTKPNSTTLLDTSCKPTATDSSRALFNFSLDSCGTTMTVEGNYLLYENEIRYSQKFLPKEDPLIHMDSPFRLTLQCRYPLNGTSALMLHPTARTTIKHPSLPQKLRQGLNWTKPLSRGLRITKGLKGP
ncbi:hypothetical protein PGIGA_G00202940 [Pangasianodon gigas]|uniref:Uncharacterized protein n=1 Tax=Pangasianodon gigas TaxID=30993 RepID=A0ACC5WFH6_PANGG|nr:hypothetical protein [Pangasianodon gigas]